MDTITKLGTTFASFVICQLLFHFVSSWFSAKVFPRFNSLSLEVKIAWNLRVVSTCHYLVIAVFCLYILLSDGAHIADPLGFDPSLVNVHVAITTGYLISDLLLHIFCWRMIGEIVYVIYRCAVLYIFCLLLTLCLLDFSGSDSLGPFVHFFILAETTLLAEGEEDLKHLLMKIKDYSQQYGLHLNIKKTKTHITGPISKIMKNGENIEAVKDFVLLGSTINTHGSSRQKIKQCIALGKCAAKDLFKVLKSKDVTLRMKFFFQNEAILAYVGNFRLITELDILFWNQRWFFETLMHSQSSEVYIINAVLLTVMFFLGRIAVIPAFYYCMYYVYGNVVYTGLELLIPCSLASGLVVLQIEEIWIPSLKNEALFLPALSSVTFFSTLVVSTCHSLVVGVFCLYILLSHGALIADPLGFDPSLVNVNIAITAGYVISALLLRIFCWRAIVFFPEWSNTGIHLEFSSDKTACLFMNQWFDPSLVNVHIAITTGYLISDGVGVAKGISTIS
ncbi:uncharacterized protein ACIGJ3_006147 isoform 6-T8 [Trichechus inunguis]